jgi:YD repeat-containing protein
MSYDATGNLATDTYKGLGNRTYDEENRMLTVDGTGGMSRYTYDADGQRVRRNSYSAAVWEVYGMGGELVAEYTAGAPASSPLKEYGYRNGEMIFAGSNSTAVNWSLSGTTSQSSTFVSGSTSFYASRATDNNTDGTFWNLHASATNYGSNSWWHEDLGTSRQITSIQVWGRMDCCPEMTSNFYVFVSDQPFNSTDLNTTINQSGSAIITSQVRAPIRRLSPSTARGGTCACNWPGLSISS